MVSSLRLSILLIGLPSFLGFYIFISVFSTLNVLYVRHVKEMTLVNDDSVFHPSKKFITTWVLKLTVFQKIILMVFCGVRQQLTATTSYQPN